MNVDEQAILRVEGISKMLGGKPILNDCSLSVRRSELKVLIGPSGAGKSTLLQSINCLIPPDTGDIETAMAQVRRYPWALLYQTIGAIEDSFDIEGMEECAREHARVSQRVQQAVRPLLQRPFLHLGCGGCRLCRTCARCDGAPCRHPGQALPSLEGSGVDVYNTVKGTSLKYVNGRNTVTFFGMVLWET